MPLPPYIKEELQDQERYQTVYSKVNGSAAAPTAGLHFTPELLERVQAMGVKVGYVTLHVGLGTFRPVKEEEITDHAMHSEYCVIPQETAELINETRKNGGRVICVGTTSCRTLESHAAEDGTMTASAGWTDIFIYPGYRFKVTDALITNFHLPESTLIMLVSALAGREHILNAYTGSSPSAMRCLFIEKRMEHFLILSLAVGAAALIVSVILLFAPRRTERRITAAAILGGLAAFSVIFALCLGYFMV